MKRNKRLEKEIKRLRRKKKKDDWFLFYGTLIIIGLIVLGLVFKLILDIKNGIYKLPYMEIPKIGTICLK